MPTQVGTSPARALTRWSHALVGLFPATGIAIQLVLIFTGGADVNSGAAGAGQPLGLRLFHLFCFFTIQSNVLVLAVAILLAVRPNRDGPVWRVVRLDSLLGIVITGIVFATILAPLIHLTGAANVATVLLHYLCPWLFLLAWLISGPRPRITWSTVAAAFVWPVLWIGFTLAHGAATGWYPYPFLDAGRLGYPTALRNILAILAAAGVIAVALRLLDRLPDVRR